MVFAVSDLHGYPLEKFKLLLEKANFSDSDFLYVLGDVIDRGKDGINILKWLIYHQNTELILGNHEQIMLNCEFLFDGTTDGTLGSLNQRKFSIYSTWAANYGRVTLDALSFMRNNEIKYILDYIREAPLYDKVAVNGNDFLLVHSGLGNFDVRKNMSEYSADELLWTRPDLDTRYFEDITTIFGHTPTVYFGEEYKGKPVITDSWINIDVGAGIGLSPLLLRLDDMKEFYI
jgi:hypothetical protein